MAKSLARRLRTQACNTTQERLSTTTALVRALYAKDWGLAVYLAKRLPAHAQLRLDSSVFATQEFQQLLISLVELSRTSIQERVSELKALKEHLPHSVYAQKQDSVMQALRRLAPGNSAGIHAVFDEASGKVITDEEGIAQLLTRHWGDTFTRKPTCSELRNMWCNESFKRIKGSCCGFRPTVSDVKLVFKGSFASSLGPDGIPFEIYKLGQDFLIDVFYEMAIAMYDGAEVPDESFNYAYLVCLPKAATGYGCDGIPYYTLASTRPLTIVDTSNRILASLFRIGLERMTRQRTGSHATSKVSYLVDNCCRMLLTLIMLRRRFQLNIDEALLCSSTCVLLFRAFRTNTCGMFCKLSIFLAPGYMLCSFSIR